MADDLLGELILTAYEHLACPPPILIAADSDGPASGGIPTSALLSEALSGLETYTAPSDAWVAAAMEGLAHGPVLGIPPWGRTTGPGPTRGPFRELQEQLLVGVHPTEPSSTLGLIVPASSLTSPSGRLFRESFRSIWHPTLVLYAIGSLSGVHASFELAFVLARPAGGGEPTKFMRLPRPGAYDPQDVREDFVRLLKRSGGRGAHGFVARTLPAPPSSLAFDHLDPEIAQQREALSDYGNSTRLGDLFDVLACVPASARHPDLEVAAGKAGALRLIRGRDVLRDGTITPPSDDDLHVVATTGTPLRVGDLLVRKMHSASDRHNLVVATVGADDLPATSDHTLIALRAQRPLTDAHRRLLLLFLTSPATGRLVRSTTHSSGMMVSAAGLLDVVAPEPDAALSAAMDDLASAAVQFNEWSARAQQLLLSVFESGSASAARARLIEEGRETRLKVEAGALIDDFDSRVRTRFPYPLAYRWRTVEVMASGRDLRATHEAVLEAFEVLLCYGAMLAHVMARTAGITLGSTETIRQKLASGSSGPGLGDWVAVLDEVASSKTVARLPEDQPLRELRQLLSNPVTDVRRRLTERRLGQAHLRRTTHEQLSVIVAEELQDLRAMFEQAAFLTDLPLLHVERVELDTLAGRSLVTYRQLMGDHPVVPYQTMTTTRTDLETGSLYVVDGRGGLHLLRPFLVGRDCPHCNTWSTFHADRTTKGVLAIKSLEHGHALDAPELVPSLQAVGLM